MLVSEPRISWGGESEQQREDPGFSLSRGGFADLEDMLRLRGTSVTADAAVSEWSGMTFGAHAVQHAAQHAFSFQPASDDFVAVAYAHPEIHVANLIGCQLAGKSFEERTLVGVTGHSTGSVHELFSLLSATSIGDRRGRVWVFDQVSPFPQDTRVDIAGRNAVCTFEINTQDSHWHYESLVTEESAAGSARPAIACWGNRDADLARGREDVADSWSSLRRGVNGHAEEVQSIVDTDSTIGLTWTTSFSWRGPKC